MHTSAIMSGALQESELSTHLVGPEDQSQVRLGARAFTHRGILAARERIFKDAHRVCVLQSPPRKYQVFS